MKKLPIIVLAVIILTVLSGCSQRNIIEPTAEISTSQVTCEPTTSKEFVEKDNSIIWKNVCRGFVTEYFTVSHSTSRYSSIKNCRKFLTPELYGKIQPSEDGKETPQGLVDVDYSSGVTIKNNCFFNENSVLLQCRVTSTVNGTKTINEYFVICKMQEVNDEWLINDFNLIAIEGSV